MTRSTLFVLTLLALTTACGGGTTTGSDGGPMIDPMLVGTWFAQITPTTADNQTETITFNAAGTYGAVHGQDDSATSTTPGCHETITDAGSFTTSGSGSSAMITITPDSTLSGQLAVTACTNASDNHTGTATPQVTGGTTAYSISGTTLTLFGTTFTRQ